MGVAKSAFNCATGAMRVVTHIRIHAYSCEKNSSVYRGTARGKSKSLVAVITAVKITRPEEFGHGNLGHFFTVAENPEFSLSGQYFFITTKETCLATFTRLICNPEVQLHGKHQMTTFLN